PRADVAHAHASRIGRGVRMAGAVTAFRGEITVVFEHVEVIFVDDAIHFRADPIARGRNADVDRLPLEGFGLPSFGKVGDKPVANPGIARVQRAGRGAETGLRPIHPKAELESEAMRFLCDGREATGKFARVGMPVADAAEPSGVNVKHVEVKIGRIAQHAKGERLVHLHAAAPTVVDKQRIIWIFPGERIGENAANPGTKNIAGSVRSAAKCAEKDRWRVKGFARQKARAKWTRIGIEAGGAG